MIEPLDPNKHLAYARHHNVLSDLDAPPLPVVPTQGPTQLLVNEATSWEDVQRLRDALASLRHGLPRRNKTPCLDGCQWCAAGDPRREA